ncbi:MAG: shikimate kinase [Candidatus Bathyarchaeota archaeon]|nr:shikimate kinase [Candidatus Bathyarchaeota archaeon]MDH5531879.1 shikimate kinase [Candidatus Bathyarchaeota archaeon]MDH5712746.1 shikimate kinase [Candidatus Bathyarchaeota archaeon]
MTGKAEALSHGAATIVNAIATGKGGAVGVDLWTRAKVQLTDKPGTIEGNIVSDPTEDPVLIEKTVGKVFEYFNLKEVGAKVRTSSNIPIARGLKSSSVAGNAIALATVAALDRSLDDLTVLNLGVEAAIEAKVTITGAFDDACASYFGGVVVTDNLKRRIVKRFEITEDLTVLFYVPAKKVYTSGSDVQRMRGVASLVGIAYKEAVKGDYWSALTLNGLIYSSALGYNPSIAVDALMAGAVAAGLSGTGPAVTAIVPEEKIDNVRDAWQTYEGDIIQARVNHEKAKVVG